MKAFIYLSLTLASVVVAAPAPQSSWGPGTCPTKEQCTASCEASGYVYADHDCGNNWVNCACNFAPGDGPSKERRQNTWGPGTCPTKEQCAASCEAAGLAYAAHDCNDAWVNCACN